MRPYLPASAAWGSPAVVSPFALDSGSWGTWEIKARYSNNDFNAMVTDPLANRVLGGEQNIVTLGANWYLNRNLRWMFDYLIADVDRRDAHGPAGRPGLQRVREPAAVQLLKREEGSRGLRASLSSRSENQRA